MANPELSQVITEAIGEGWITDWRRDRQAETASPTIPPFDSIPACQARRKARFVDWIKSSSGQTVDPDSIFDCQIKRIHEYKRQMLNALQIVVLYNRLRANPTSK